MGPTLLRTPSFFARNLFHSPANVWIPIPGPRFVPVGGISTRSGLFFFSSEPGSSCRSERDRTPDSGSPTEDEAVSTKELKRRIGKFFDDGNEKDIPAIFEAILKRKLSGKHEESDSELMEELREKHPIDKLDMGDEDDWDGETDDGLKEKNESESD